MKADFFDSQSLCFFGALGLYALFGSPTPDSIGVVEVVMGLLMALSLRIENIRSNIGGWLVLLLGLVVPLITGLIRGQDFQSQIRDIIPFLFLFLPLFYGWVVQQRASYFLFSLTIVGLFFSLRSIWSYRDILMTPFLWGHGPPADLLYLANSPEVLFSALYCLGMGGVFLLRDRLFIKGVGVILISFIPVLAMALMMQRAGLGAVVFVLVLFFGYLLAVRPRQAILILMVVVGIGVAAFPIIQSVFITMWQKTELVGLNSRQQEWAAVWDIIRSDWGVALFGKGWGGHIDNPAVGGLSVNYTHSLLSFLLLKTGILGAVIIGAGVALPVSRGGRALFYTDKVEFILVLALFLPFLISFFLYASYKSLGFGLILLAFSHLSSRKLEKNPLSVS